ncbi:MAG: glycosyltransferase [Anaerolineales bacterium]|nr:glycosyltransferase [Anaerolineales bacterium]
MTAIGWVYAAALLLMAVYGFNMWLMALLAARLWLRRPPPAAPPAAPDRDWPAVLVQLPLCNERFVAERLLEAVAALDYPRERLIIQVLDDSTDDTSSLLRARVAQFRARGVRMEYLHRLQRGGFKAGALAAGLAAQPEGDLVAIFDADFVPAPDFLRRAVPFFDGRPRLGMLQTRWEHLNADHDLLTQAQALALDAFFGAEQVVRSHYGLFMNFNGSGGLWRRAAIADAGGWDGGTLAEDLDLSYRAQLKGWRFAYTPDVPAPAELPTTLSAFKRQQFRWAKGSLQVARKVGWQLLTAPGESLWRKWSGVLHLTGYVPHALMILSLLLSLPIVLLEHGQTPLRWGLMGLAGFGPILLGLVAQLALRPDWPRRITRYPALLLLGIGLALTNTQALIQAALGTRTEFLRTPKGPPGRGGANYSVPLDWTTWGETFLAFYALVTGMLALQLAPPLAPMAFIYALGFGFTAGLGFWQADRGEQRKAARDPR